jgi:uncharacterized Tic20 family protein
MEVNQIAALHITPIAFFFFPVIGNIITPFIFWMLKREDVTGIFKQSGNLECNPLGLGRGSIF